MRDEPDLPSRGLRGRLYRRDSLHPFGSMQGRCDQLLDRGFRMYPLGQPARRYGVWFEPGLQQRRLQRVLHPGGDVLREQSVQDRPAQLREGNAEVPGRHRPAQRDFLRNQSRLQLRFVRLLRRRTRMLPFQSM